MCRYTERVGEADTLEADIGMCLEAAVRMRELGVRRIQVGDIIIEMAPQAEHAFARAMQEATGEMRRESDDPNEGKRARFRVMFGREPNDQELEVFAG